MIMGQDFFQLGFWGICSYLLHSVSHPWNFSVNTDLRALVGRTLYCVWTKFSANQKMWFCKTTIESRTPSNQTSRVFSWSAPLAGGTAGPRLGSLGMGELSDAASTATAAMGFVKLRTKRGVGACQGRVHQASCADAGTSAAPLSACCPQPAGTSECASAVTNPAPLAREGGAPSVLKPVPNECRSLHTVGQILAACEAALPGWVPPVPQLLVRVWHWCPMLASSPDKTTEFRDFCRTSQSVFRLGHQPCW
jgi:hypothetical protein